VLRRDMLRDIQAYDYGLTIADRALDMRIAAGDVFRIKDGKKSLQDRPRFRAGTLTVTALALGRRMMCHKMAATDGVHFPTKVSACIRRSSLSPALRILAKFWRNVTNSQQMSQLKTRPLDVRHPAVDLR
jgi:hypothetical protein